MATSTSSGGGSGRGYPSVSVRSLRALGAVADAVVMPPMTITPHTGSRIAAEPWLSKAEVAGHYGVSIRTVERWMFAGCPSRLVGGVRRLQLSAVEVFLPALQGGEA